ncbi:transmembrane 4 L6 family member 18 isoform X2 [Ornithorhynchus anatinus]|uniref:transmembrane 4 L6 family member 18 isoform X2 n=1 Tax=Ornithorhynchus anatinus TaxID=9258 RepID=UPI0010A9204E|nr:transmembrane 4 L6 family member 18 isoform X2 [Ornithorhynchus anatinus]
MGTWKCGGCLSCLLIPLAFWSITVNILLYFPNGQASYASSNKLTNYVWYFEGICFSGVMSFLSIVFSLLGFAFSGYCLVISGLALVQGPYCRTLAGWEYAFEDTAGRFLTDPSSWTQCLEPAHVVEWNIILFAVLIALSGLQAAICLLKVIMKLSRILCGTYSVIIQAGVI